jgi:hypothetical protein
MAQTIIFPQGTAEITVPASQSIAISNFGGGIARIYYLINAVAFPPSFQFQQTLEDSSVTLGAFSAETIVKIEAGNSKVVYDVGSSPDTGIGDADTLNGQAGSYYLNADNINAGTLSDDRLPGTITSDITGNAATASNSSQLNGQSAAYYATDSLVVHLAGAEEVTGEKYFSAGLNFGESTLSIYEESTFTPVAEGLTSAGVGTYSSQLGSYQKIGNWVHFTMFLEWSAHTGTGDLSVNGLPYTCAATGGNTSVSITPKGLTYAADGVSALIVNSTTKIYIYETASNTNISRLAMDTAAGFYISGSYETT